jgi:hypothetical protein
MAETILVKKLGIKDGHKLLILNAPDGYLKTLGALPEGAALKTDGTGSFDFVQLFVYSVADVDSRAPAAIKALKSGGLLWVCYPKKSSKIKTDINRDAGWETMHKAEFEGVSLISIDDTWSAMRFRPRSETKRRA